MKISTKGRYGLRAMVDLALNSKENHVPLNSIAERQAISVQYLEQVFSVLKKADLVKSIKGANGGYTLSMPAKDMTVGSILKTLEGNLSIVGGSQASDLNELNSIERCISEMLWQKIDDSINTIVEGMTLYDLAEDSRRYNDVNQIMFYI